MKHTAATKRRLSEMRKGKLNPFYGKKHSSETKEKLGVILRSYQANRTYDIAPPTIQVPGGNALAYLAGIVDGEGSIGFRKQSPYIAVYNGDKTLFEWFTEQTSKAPRWTDFRGRVPGWQWSISGANNVYVLCKALLPLLIVKRKNGLAVMKYLEDRYGQRLSNSMD